MVAIVFKKHSHLVKRLVLVELVQGLALGLKLFVTHEGKLRPPGLWGDDAHDSSSLAGLGNGADVRERVSHVLKGGVKGWGLWHGHLLASNVDERLAHRLVRCAGCHCGAGVLPACAGLMPVVARTTCATCQQRRRWWQRNDGNDVYGDPQ